MEKIPNIPTFVVPNLERERGEIRRVAQEVFDLNDPEKIRQFGIQFLEAAKTAPLVELSEDIWSKLQNTDSYGIPSQDWSLVEEHAVGGHPDSPRDWQFYKARCEQGDPVDAPTILKTGETYHLVSGNTRLMVARALGITPKVLLVELD